MEKKKRILVIDDEKAIRDVISAMLKNKGYDVLVAEDGTTARKLIDEHSFHLVICDLLLPGEHGLEIIKYIKDKYFLPVIVISGIYSDDELKNEIDALFIDCFLRKPIESQTLYTQVESLLNKKRSETDIPEDTEVLEPDDLI